ncbi:hypothetical protein JCM21900_004623 [Sporobolomyces salmonicolor]
MPFTPVPSLVGGILLSFSTSSLFLEQGRILGCSGVAHSAISSSIARLLSSPSPAHPSSTGPTDDTKSVRSTQECSIGWKWATFLGLLAGGAALRLARAPVERLVGAVFFEPPLAVGQVGWVRAALAGLAVGAGTKLANGCTSGHMLIGLARFSKRSIVATVTFFSCALLTARLVPYPLPPSTPSFASFSPSSITPTILFLFLTPIVASLTAYRLFRSRSLAATVQSFSLGFLFSLGLALTGMLRPSKVLAFFYVPVPFPSSTYYLPPWDPSLAMVALGGLLPNILVWHFIAKRRGTPRREAKWEVPAGGNVDRKLVVGSALFGVGWGLMGICPGPLIAVLGSGMGGSALSLFAVAFAVGGLVSGLF